MNATPRPPITRNLRLLKEHRDVTWTEIARAVQVTDRLVTAWGSEDGTDPSWPNIIKLAVFFDVEPHVFYVADFDPATHTRATA